MTYKEKIIATAYTGCTFIDGSQIGDLYKYIEMKTGKPTFDLCFISDEFNSNVKRAVYADFMEMITNGADNIEVPQKYKDAGPVEKPKLGKLKYGE